MPHISDFQRCCREGKGSCSSYAVLMQIESRHTLGIWERGECQLHADIEFISGLGGKDQVKKRMTLRVASHSGLQPVPAALL